jgi:ABC-type transport system involved in cytochrome bd biosynthesis fused ATPase/permease subunit
VDGAALGWKVMLPGALAYVVLMAASILVLDTLGVPFGFVYGLILTGVNLLATVLFLVVIDRDRVIAGNAPLKDREWSPWAGTGRSDTVTPGRRDRVGSAGRTGSQGSEWP